MNSAVAVAGWALVEVLLLVVGAAGLSSDYYQFVAIGYVAIVCMIVAPFLATKQLISIKGSKRNRRNKP